MSEPNSIELYWSQLRAAVELAWQYPVDSAADLANCLYDNWYTPEVAEPESDASPAVLVAHLRASDAFGSRFESGWTAVDGTKAAEQIGGANSPWQVAVARDSEMRWVDPVDLVYTGSIGLKPPPGAAVEVSQRRDSVHSLPGWWSALSPTWQDKGSAPLVRLYWSIPLSAVCELVHALTRQLNPNIPYALKCPLDLARYRRPDAVTLYLATSAWETAAPAIRAAHEQNLDFLRQRTPAFTFRLAQGLALAEDPVQDSFGMTWCKILAESMWLLVRVNGKRDIMQEVERSIRDHGFRLDAPYLNPGSTTQYPW